MSNATEVRGGIGLAGAVFLVFLAARLTDHIAWAWYWVASPLWIPLAGVLAIAAVVAGVVGILAAVDGVRRSRRRKSARAAKAGGRQQ